MTYMFSNTTVSNDLNLTDFQTTNVTGMNAMLKGTSLTNLDLSGWDVTQVTNCNSMLSNNNELRTLNLANWDTASVTSNSSMFTGNSKLWQITLGEKIKFSGTLGFVAAPAANTEFTDNGQNYMVTTPSWQAVGSGTGHRPTGDLVTTTQMYADRTAPVTYVWAQAPTFVEVSNVEFGTLSASSFSNGQSPLAINGDTGIVKIINLSPSFNYDVTVAQTGD
ncbi:BspA family leucine-rich repeat surface protein [Leuconostoc falkenbergense]|uniref:BspA family leucine-rich repeat surface protein n=1 Tax=Leuconostoc falkenbergense TaxID=2766470 RepID=UPI0024ACCB78|nr:BspA family leucine-rich repeat surface protein [Leuconostoc falkenbergense]MDI6667424.1 BspA family leucine-rich repeat surface protein [Leuconostoc falkenbergense]